MGMTITVKLDDNGTVIVIHMHQHTRFVQITNSIYDYRVGQKSGP